MFLEQGYERARVQDIARAAGLTTGAIYANYRDKSELLLAAIAGKSAAEVETLLASARRTRAARPPRELGSRMAFREHERPLLLEAVVASQRDPALAALLREQLGRAPRAVRRDSSSAARPTTRSTRRSTPTPSPASASRSRSGRSWCGRWSSRIPTPTTGTR